MILKSSFYQANCHHLQVRLFRRIKTKLNDVTCRTFRPACFDEQKTKLTTSPVTVSLTLSPNLPWSRIIHATRRISSIPNHRKNRVFSAHIQRVHMFCRFQLIFVLTAAFSCQHQQLRSPTDRACQPHKHISTDSFVCANKMISSLHSAYSSTLKTSSV